ncbi:MULTISPECIES: hypothetical protein [unclassified Pseudoalteromonas]
MAEIELKGLLQELGAKYKACFSMVRFGDF